MNAPVATRATDGLTGSRLVMLVLICGLAITFDGYDLVVFGTTTSHLMKEFHVGPPQLGTVGSYALMGMMLGALGAGAAADKFGRRVLLIGSVVWFSLWMIVAAMAPSLAVFSIARFLCGLGLGGCMPTATAIVVEYAPRGRSNLTYGIMQSGFAVGGILAAGLGILLLPHTHWRTLYWIGGIAPLLLVALPALKFLPESIDLLLVRGQRDKAEQLATRLGLGVPESLPTKEKGSLATLFSRSLALPTILFWLTTFCCLLLVYGMNSWLPEIMRKQGYQLGSALSFLLVFNLGSIVGSVIAGIFADRIGNKPMIIISYALAVISAVGLSFRPDLLILYFLVAIGGQGAIGTQNLINPFVTSYYPAYARGTGIGWSLGIGRIGAICGPIIGGVVLGSSLGVAWNFYVFAIVALLGAIAVALVPRRRTALDSSPAPTEVTPAG